jgi:hypothetical protein
LFTGHISVGTFRFGDTAVREPNDMIVNMCKNTMIVGGAVLLMLATGKKQYTDNKILYYYNDTDVARSAARETVTV